MVLPNLGSFSSPSAAYMDSNVTSSSDDPNRKVRKPYTISKSRESWTEPEHDKFLEAVQLFDRDWKKIEAFVGSKSVIQIRSHAQKYFLKVQKSGVNEHLPPPRPKRKAAHPYPQKASKFGVSQRIASLQTSPVVPDTGIGRMPDFPLLPGHSDTAPSTPGRMANPVQSASFSHETRGDVIYAGQSLPSNCCCFRNDNIPRTRPTVLPDFAQVYSFIGSVFDPNVNGHLQKLKKMDPIDIETVLLLMRNLSINLSSPDFEDHRHLLSSYEIDPKENAYDVTSSIPSSQSKNEA